MKRLFVLLLISAISLSAWSASDTPKLPAQVASYLTQVSSQLKLIDTNVSMASDFLGGKNSKTKDDALKAKAQLDKMVKDLDGIKPPVQALGLHAQLGYALKDCAHFADTVSQIKGKDDVNAFSISIFLILGDRCGNGIQASTLRMLDIYSAAGVMPPK